MPEDEYERLRRQFKPEHVRVLLIGESRPADGTFFYSGDSNLYRYTRDAFQAATGREFGTPEEFLSAFKESGCCLLDLCTEPVNRMTPPQRREQRERGVEPLSAQLKRLAPEHMICVMKAIEPYVTDAVCRAGRDPADLAVLPFPAQGHQQEYMLGLEEALRDFGIGA